MNIAIQLSGLIFLCPFYEELKGCPFEEPRKLKFEARMDYFNNLFDEEISEIKMKHYNCLAQRTERLSKNANSRIDQSSKEYLNSIED